MTESLFSNSDISVLVFQLSFSSKDESYWLGVRDALRMIDSFLKWRSRNPNKAKPLDQFMHEALIAAAKRCESCLSHALGIQFSSEGEEEPSHTEGSGVDFFEKAESMVEDSPLARTLTDPGDLYSGETHPADDSATEAPPEDDYVAPDDAELPDSPLLHEDSEDAEAEERIEPAFDDVESASIDHIERTSEDASREPDFDAERDFSEEFELSEPQDLIIEDAEHESEAHSAPVPVPDEPEVPETEDEASFQVDIESTSSEAESPKVEWDETDDEEPSEGEDPRLSGALDQLERAFSSYGVEISPHPSEEDEFTDEVEADAETTEDDASEDAADDSGSFTWHDYERSVIPDADEVTHPDEDAEVDEGPHRGYVDEDDLKPPDPTEVGPVEDESEEPSLWTPYDEPSTVDSEDSEEFGEKEEEDETEPSESKEAKTPPPPPPPESDESEEERRRRARRLFFGA